MFITERKWNLENNVDYLHFLSIEAIKTFIYSSKYSQKISKVAESKVRLMIQVF